MSIAKVIADMKKEVAAKVNEAIETEIRQMELDDEQLRELETELPGLVLSKLTTKEQARAKELITALDKQVSRLAELTWEIGQTVNEYRPALSELISLLVDKDHDIHVRYSPSKLKFMLNELGRIIGTDCYNAALGFKPFPGKDTIEAQLQKYQGI